jgi:cell division protein FtsQ
MWDSPRVLNLAALLIAAVAIAAFVAGAAAWASRRPIFALKSIRVEPDVLFGAASATPFRHVNAVTIRAQAIPTILATTRNNFFTVDLEAVRHAIESVSWVRRAQVRREWPDRLVVKVEEHQVLGTWDDGRLVNTFGELFAANSAEAEEDSRTPLPELSGPIGSERDVASRYVDFKNWLARLSLVPDQVALSPRYAWSVHVDNGSENGEGNGLLIELGRERDGNTIPERVLRMIRAWPQLTARWPKPTLIDLRYPNGFALRAEGLRLAEEGARPAARVAAKKPHAATAARQAPAHIPSNSRPTKPEVKATQ